MIIMTGATVNNNSAIKAADDHGNQLNDGNQSKAQHSKAQHWLLRTYPQNFSSGAWYRSMYNAYHQ